MLKKQANHKQLNKLAKSAVAVALAGTFTFSAVPVFAAGTTTGQDNYQTVALPSGTTSGTNPTSTTASATQTQTQEPPHLVPGDFFYFVKIVFEKIRLALTFDDTAKAKLLAGYASERLAEAHSLLAAGQQQTAANTINQALKDMQDADTMAGSLKQAQPANNDSQQADSQNGGTTQGTDNTSQAGQAKGNVQTKMDNQNWDEINNLLSQNIAPLTTVLNQVKNPVAKAAIERNIEKSYAKLIEKLDRMNARLTKRNGGQAANNDTANQNPNAANMTTGSAANSTAAAAGTAVSASTNPAGTDGSTAANTSSGYKPASITNDRKPLEKPIRQEVKQLKQTAQRDLK